MYPVPPCRAVETPDCRLVDRVHSRLCAPKEHSLRVVCHEQASEANLQSAGARQQIFVRDIKLVSSALDQESHQDGWCVSCFRKRKMSKSLIATRDWQSLASYVAPDFLNICITVLKSAWIGRG